MSNKEIKMYNYLDKDMKKYSGTTTLAIKCQDGVVLGSDTRVTAGYFIAHKTGRKIFKIKEHLAVTIAGVVADAQAIIDSLKFYANLYEINYGRPLNARSAAKLLSLILYQNRLYPLITELIIAGKDNDKYSIYKLDPFGSLVEDNYAVSGSGSPIAMGVIESEYNKDMSIEEGVKLAVKALLSAMKRDIGSGDDFNIAIINEKGYTELKKEEKEKYLSNFSSLKT